MQDRSICKSKINLHNACKNTIDYVESKDPVREMCSKAVEAFLDCTVSRQRYKAALPLSYPMQCGEHSTFYPAKYKIQLLRLVEDGRQHV